MSTCHIASIHWSSFHWDRGLYGGYYDIPAAPRGGDPVMIEITDKRQRWQGPYSLSPKGTTRVQMEQLILGEEIARDLVAEKTQFGVGMNPQCHPGIWMVRERIPVTNSDGSPQLDVEQHSIWRSATDAEKRQMWAEDLAEARVADAAYAEMLIRKADQDAEDPRKVPFIPQVAKLAARQYGVERDWLKELAGADRKACPYCGTIVSTQVAICKDCGNIVNTELYAALEAKKKTAGIKEPAHAGR